MYNRVHHFWSIYENNVWSTIPDLYNINKYFKFKNCDYAQVIDNILSFSIL